MGDVFAPEPVTTPQSTDNMSATLSQLLQQRHILPGSFDQVKNGPQIDVSEGALQDMNEINNNPLVRQELKVEALDEKEGFAKYLPSWRSAALKNIPDETHRESTDTVSADSDNSRVPIAPVRLSEQNKDACYGQSTMELGVEIDEEIIDISTPEPAASKMTSNTNIMPSQFLQRRSILPGSSDQEKTDPRIEANRGVSQDTDNTDSNPLVRHKLKGEVPYEKDASAEYLSSRRQGSLENLPDETRNESTGTTSAYNNTIRETNAPVRLSEQDRNACYGQSTMDLGVEIDNEIKTSDKNDKFQETDAPVRLSEQDRNACYRQSTMDLGVEI